VAFLGTTLEISAANLRAVIAPFWERTLEEYRIGFTVRGQDAVVHGVFWPEPELKISRMARMMRPSSPRPAAYRNPEVISILLMPKPRRFGL